MINGAVHPKLQNAATLDQQQQTSVKATGDPPPTAINDGDSQSTVTASTIVNLGAKQAEQLTYSSPVVQTVAADGDQSNVTGGIRKPPPQSIVTTDDEQNNVFGGIKQGPPESSATIEPLATAAPSGDENNVIGGIKRPPP